MSVRPVAPDRVPASQADPEAAASGPRTGSAAWRPGDPVGDRLFCRVGAVDLERGGRLPEVTVAYETWGRLNAAGDNAVLVEHALTGDSHVVGDVSPGHATPGWWPELIGPGAPLDSERYFVVATNVLGGCQGTTGPAATAPDGKAWGSRFPFVTIRDQVEVEARVAVELGVSRWRAVLGGSMGGMRVLEWAASRPDQLDTAVVLASSAYATAEQIGWSRTQISAIEQDPDFRGGDYYDAAAPDAGLALARRIAHITYRSEPELDQRFGRRSQRGGDPLGGDGKFEVESYLDHHGGKLAGRFDANSYIVLSEAMNSHDVGRDRGGVAAALGRFEGDLLAVSVDSDRLYPPRLSEEIVRAAATSTARHETISSLVGHDGFLTETDQVGDILREVLRPPRAGG